MTTEKNKSVPLDLYLVRHASAVDIGAPGVETDADRVLSPEGLEEALHTAKGLATMAKRLRLILTSPLPRARQTADILAEVLGGVDVEETNLLKPGATFEEVTGHINQKDDNGSYLLVGHNPDLEEIIAEALHVGRSGDVCLKKAGLAILRFEGPIEAGQGQLRVLMTSKHLEAIGE